jgi:hypothetical protein
MPREERVNIALSQLVEHTVPVYADDDADAINERLDQAFANAHHILER